MTPHRSHGAGTFVLDRRFGPICRIERSSGTTDEHVFDALNIALTELYRLGRLDLLRAVRDGILHPLELYEAFRTSKLDQLPTAEDVRPLRAAIDAWLPTADIRPVTRANYERDLHRLVPEESTARIIDLPALLKAEREACHAQKGPKAGQRTTFNRIRAASQAFLRDILGQSHRIYAQVRAVRKLTETPRRGNPLTVARAIELAEALGMIHGATMWALCLTGMRRGEYWGRWEVVGDRVLIHGTKTAGSERFVPLIRPIAAPLTTYWGFAQALRKLTGGFVRVHDLRKTFGAWCDNAGVSKARTRLYLGHGRRDVTDLYTEQDVRTFLRADAEKLEAFIAEQSREKSRDAGAGPKLEAM